MIHDQASGNKTNYDDVKRMGHYDSHMTFGHINFTIEFILHLHTFHTNSVTKTNKILTSTGFRQWTGIHTSKQAVKGPENIKYVNIYEIQPSIET